MPLLNWKVEILGWAHFNQNWQLFIRTRPLEVVKPVENVVNHLPMSAITVHISEGSALLPGG